MTPRVQCTCPECSEVIDQSVEHDVVPVPSPDLTEDVALDGISVAWECPTCARLFGTVVVPDLADGGIPWVGSIGDTDVLVDFDTQEVLEDDDLS